ncbi:substrate-binding periplasmic protein [Halobacteriovorax marinus]|uniref:substrate-binding periplasmic protein n=1 Tax=Halobacteriovorax marinus TaxID=97084 RepID=UPI003A944A80
MIRRLISIFVILLSISINANQIELSSFNYPPFLQPDNQGFVDKLIKQFSKHSSLDIKVVKLPAKRSINSYKNGTSFYHLGADDNFSKVTLNNSYKVTLFDLNVRLLFLKKNESHLHKDLEKLQNIKIGILRGSLKEEEFAKKHGFEITSYIDSENAFNLLLRGRIDFIIFSPLFNSVKDIVDKKNFDKFAYHRKLVHHAEAAIFINKTSPNAKEVYKTLNKKMTQFLKSKDYQKLLHETFQSDIPEEITKYTL